MTRGNETSVFVGRSASSGARICFGLADRRRTVRGGALHIFGPEQVVGYLIANERGQHCYVFRTSGSDARAEFAARLVGITPAVIVLIAAIGRNQCSRVVRLLDVIARAHVAPATLSDMFFLRAAEARERYVPLEKTVAGLLRHELQSTVPSRVRANSSGVQP